jgi:hypothetical protein
MNEQLMPQKIMSEIHRLVQKLKESGMEVDSTLGTQTKLVDGTVKYTDSLDITGVFKTVRFDPRPVAQVKEEAVAQKEAIQAQADAVKAQLDDVIAEVDSAPIVPVDTPVEK